jgi:hypothetical protein
MKKSYLSVLLMMCLFSMKVLAQDIIVKNNKSEIRAKVLELSDTDIKYKKFENLEGPAYSIKKAEVFMIIYKNGQRETITSPQVSPAIPIATSSAPQATATVQEEDSTRVRLPDGRLTGYFSSVSSELDEDYSASSFTLDLSLEANVVRNYINFGFGYGYTTVSYDGESSTSSNLHAYLAGYLPVNKMTENPNIHKGFFPFARFGYRYAFGSNGASGAGASLYDVGLDYRFSKKFGISVVTSKFDTFGFGIVLTR